MNSTTVNPAAASSTTESLGAAGSSFAGPVSRRRLLAGLAAVPAIGLLVAACGSPTSGDAGSESTSGAGTSGAGSTPETTPGTTPETTPETTPNAEIAYPADAATAVIRLSYEGGFVPESYAFASLPVLVIAGDGHLYTPAPTTEIYPGPLVAPISVRTITPAAIQRLLRVISDAGLLADAPDYSSESNIADAPNTVLRVTTADGTFVHSAYALGIFSDSSGVPTTEPTPARQRLLEVVDQLQVLVASPADDELGVDEAYVPTAYRLKAFVADEATASTMDPEPTITDWPASTGVHLADAVDEGGVRLDAAHGADVLSSATTLSWFRDPDPSGAVVYFLAAAAVLPGDPVR